MESIMKSVNIARFNAELGKYLGYVRKGEEVIIFDRKEPLAQVVPYHKAPDGLEIEEATRPGPIFKTPTNSLQFLLEERGER